MPEKKPAEEKKAEDAKPAEDSKPAPKPAAKPTGQATAPLLTMRKQQGWWPEDGAFDIADKDLSNKIHALVLAEADFPVSCASLLGMPTVIPATVLFIGMLTGDEPHVAGWGVLLLLIGAMFYAWLMFVLGNSKMGMKYFFSFTSLAVPVVGLIIARPIVGYKGWGHGAFHPTCAFVSYLLCKLVQFKMMRKRPVIGTPTPTMKAGGPKAPPKRRIKTIQQMLIHDKPSSFPSGDVASATTLAVTLYLALGWILIPAFIIVSISFTRIYFRAHYIFDCVVGFLVGLLSVYIVRRFVCEIGEVRSWQPVLSQALFVGANMGLRKLRL